MDTNFVNPELSVAEFRETAANIEAEVAKVIVGQKEVVRHVLIGILSGGHVLLEGVPGIAKTKIAKIQPLATPNGNESSAASPTHLR